MELLKLEKGQRVSLSISFNGAYDVTVINQTKKRKFTDIEANGIKTRILTLYVVKILEASNESRAIANNEHQKEKCPCCDGKGMFSDEYIDEIVGCQTCLGKGYFD